MTGRAGRRGLDSVGHAVVVWSPQVSMARRGRAGHLAAARPAVVVPGHLQPGRQPGAPLPGRPGALHLDRSFAQFLDSRSPPRPVAAPGPGPGAARGLGVRASIDAWRSRHAGRCWPGSTTSRTCWWPRRWPRGSSTDSTRRAGGRGLGLHLRGAPGRGRARARRAPAGGCGPGWPPWRSWASACGPRGGSRTPAGHAGARRRVRRAWRGAGPGASGSSASSSGPSLAPGDFVRNAKQLVDLLRQLAVASAGPSLRHGRRGRSSAAWWLGSAGWSLTLECWPAAAAASGGPGGTKDLAGPGAGERRLWGRYRGPPPRRTGRP